MKVFLQDRFVPESEARVSVFDRGFLYGDGVFETLRALGGHPLFWEAHRHRLESALHTLHLALPDPHSPEALLPLVQAALQENHLSDAIVRIAVSRGPGPRGYSPRGAGPSTLVISAHPGPPVDAPAPPPRALATVSLRLPAGDPLTPIKSASRLLHVLARREAEEAGADDALLLNAHGNVAEAGSANLFWFTRDTLETPALHTGALPGITRSLVVELAATLGWPFREVAAAPSALTESNGAFLTLSTLGPVAVRSVDGRTLPADPRFEILRQAYLNRLIAERDRLTVTRPR